MKDRIKRASFPNRLCLLSFFAIIFFIVNVSSAEASTFYWYSTSSTDWNSASNWWTDTSHSIPANTAPTNITDTVLLGTVAPIVNLDSWVTPLSLNSYGLIGSAKTSGVIFTSTNSASSTVNITGNATFNGNSKNTGIILGNSSFNSTSSNQGTVDGDATFNDSSYNLKIVEHNAFYTNPNYQQSLNNGLIYGDATLAFASSSIATFNNTSWGTVVGNIKGSDNLVVNNFVFNGASSTNYGILTGTSTFNNAVNFGTTTNAVFNNNGLNEAVVTGDAIFNDTSQNYHLKKNMFDTIYLVGSVGGTATFNGSSKNFHAAVGSAIFNGNSTNSGSVVRDATFNDHSIGYLMSALLGNTLFNGDNSYSCGSYFNSSSTKTRRYTSNATTTFDFHGSTSGGSSFQGPWTILADGVNVHLGNPNFYDLSTTTSLTYTTFKTANGGVFDLSVDSPLPTAKSFTCTTDPTPVPFYDPSYSSPPSTTDPVVISNIYSTTTPNSATINWTTNSNFVSAVTIPVFNIAKFDSGPAGNHSMTLSNLSACSTYLYTVSSFLLNGNNVSSSHSFTTTGCTGNSSVIEATTTLDVSTETGANITFVANNGQTLTMRVPMNYTSTSSLATFELTRIDTGTLLSAVSTPLGQNSAGLNTYQLRALTDSSTVLSTFSRPITITMSYPPDGIDDIDPLTLNIQRYDDDTGWTSLPNCSVDTNAHTVTCTTDHFSAISLFGLHLSLPTNQRSVGHSGSILPAFAATSTGISSSLNGEVKTPADVAALKAELNTKIVSVIKQLIDLLTQRLNSLLGI